MAAAVGSLSSRRIGNPASLAASLVAWRCASSKYAGTVTTAPSTGPSSAASARSRSNAHHAGRVDEAIRKTAIVVEVGKAAPHQSLYRHDRVLRIERLLRHR